MTLPPEVHARHYRVEKELAARLRDAPANERVTLYSVVYDELYRRLPDHPMLVAKAQQAQLRRDAVGRKLRLLRPYLKPSSVFMELGPGDCQLSMAVAPQVGEVIAAEVSEVISSREAWPANMRLAIISHPTEIPAPAGSVDVIYGDNIAEHLHPDDFVEQTRHVFEALAPGGHYLIMTPNRLNGPWDVSRGFDAIATGLHLREYTFTELRRLLLDTGFERVQPIVGLRGIYARFPAALVTATEALLAALPDRLSRWLANTMPLQVVLAIRLVATRPTASA